MNMHFSPLVRRAGVGLLALSLALGLSACGGGGGNPGAVTGTGSGSGGTSTAAPTVAVSFVNASGQASNSLTSATQLTVRATVKDKDGKAVPNALVSFATDATLAVFSPSNGTALTDANGLASITMRAASLAAGGAGTVTATSSVGGSTVAGTANYSVGTTTLTFGTLSANPTSLQAYGSTVLSVDVLAGSSKYTEQPVNVTFSSVCQAAGKATLSTLVATNNGTAQTVYRDQGCASTDTITVSATGIARAATQTLPIAAPSPASVQFVEATPTDKSIVIAGQGGVGRTETATLKFRVFDIFNNPLAGRQVSFSASTTAVTVNKLSDTTDQNGEVVTTVNSGNIATTFRVLASLPGSGGNGKPDFSTWSDSIVVTTGLPVQRAFSLSTGAFNLDSSYDSSPTLPATRLQVMIADLSGNPVPDGTPVVFQTNMGSVGSSSKGGCNTTNGGCSVDFRMQNPRIPTPGSPPTPCNAATPDYTRAGVATVCASSTDGVNTVWERIPLFFSTTGAAKVYMDGGDTAISGTNASPIDLGTISATAARVFSLQINDKNDNPMPVGTTVSVVNMLNGIANSPVPATVPSIPPTWSGGTFAARQGSSHAFSISSATGKNCTGPVTATFSVAITTAAPSSVTTMIPFKLAFTCP